MPIYPHKILLALVCATLPNFAYAVGTIYNDSNETAVTETLPDAGYGVKETRVTLGLGLTDSSRYIGSNSQRIRVMPTLNATWGDGWFAGFPRGIGYNFSKDPALDYGLRLAIDMGRKQSASPALNGMGNISAKPELGTFLNFSLSKQVRFTSDLHYGAGNDGQGALLSLGLHYRIPLDEQQSFTIGIGTNFANGHYMQSFYGVNATQSAKSGYAIYTPSAGMRELDLTASYRYKIDRKWSLLTGATLGHLGSAISSSPIARGNTHNSIYVQTNYTF